MCILRLEKVQKRAREISLGSSYNGYEDALATLGSLSEDTPTVRGDDAEQAFPPVPPPYARPASQTYTLIRS